ncbi:hypothetical protein TM49_02885 [Martelella endophytica]|uniref:SMP-30/Gluconolactonase/LRE-like region domain-containing protein n=1 Tax=Martelella endophytica TaxID=1486262 RepID=A0A0D5LWV1_MAREN|nr:hypothetical protein TM49_02885 [Martelella endophytica]
MLCNCEDMLGECPVWLEEENVLAWVDIGRRLWHRLDWQTGTLRSIGFDTALTAFAPSAKGGFIGAFADGIAPFSADGMRGPFWHQPESNLPDNRFNDGGTDHRGRFIAGSMNMARSGATGRLYALAADGALTQLKDGIGIVNTIAFSLDGTVLYTADSAVGVLAAFHYDPMTGIVGARRDDFRPDPGLPGTPDGSAVDAEGFVWNARWDGGCLVRLAPDGRTDRIVELPVSRPTSCAFVGETLVVTTSTWDFKEADFAAQPHAGALLRLDVGVAGAPKTAFCT